MPDRLYPDPREEDIYAGDRRLSRPDSALPDWHIPDASYRPVPIAWFAGAVLMQVVVLCVLFMILLASSGWVTIVLAPLATLAIGGWTWQRGMKDAGIRWQVATVMMLTLQLGFICLAAASRV